MTEYIRDDSLFGNLKNVWEEARNHFAKQQQKSPSEPSKESDSDFANLERKRKGKGKMTIDIKEEPAEQKSPSEASEESDSDFEILCVKILGNTRQKNNKIYHLDRQTFTLKISVGLGTLLSGSRIISDGMLQAAAERIKRHSSASPRNC